MLLHRLEAVGYKPHLPPERSLIGYDPVAELPEDHLARLVERVVEEAGDVPAEVSAIGQSGYDPRLLAKLLVYSYSIGVVSSRRIEQNCSENLAYLFLSRGARPCFRTICGARTSYRSYLQRIWLTLVATASSAGLCCVGRVFVDASRFKANASRDLVIAEEDYGSLIERFDEMLAAAQTVDAKEDEEGQAQPTRTGLPSSSVTVRRVVRSLGKDAPEGPISPRCKKRMQECAQTLERARNEGAKHVSLSDPDARMMPIGSRRVVSMGHGLELAVDSGVLVAGSSTSEPSDTGRLQPLVKEAQIHDPAPVKAVVADSGYFDACDIVSLESEGLEVVVPDSTTVSRMRKGEPVSQEDPVHFEKVDGRDAYRCPEGNILTRKGPVGKRGRFLYRASKPCTDCPLAQVCLKNPGAKRRTLSVRPHAERMKPYLQSFDDPATRSKYYARGPGVETAFAVFRQILRFVHWSVRGAAKVAAEAELLKCAYMVRKVHRAEAQAA